MACAIAAAGVVGYCVSMCLPRKKLVNVRRIGDRLGRPIVASCWSDILKLFSGDNPRIFFPNGDEILVSDRTREFFKLLPPQQTLYIAPNGEDFNPIEVLERLDEEQIQSASEQYNRLVDACFDKCVPQFADWKDKGNEGVSEYIRFCVSKYMEVSKHASSAFNNASGNL
eukprot:CAMPEP_0177652278 /NCGR_PEP_ID=MMETSP0447-20121125/13030_1 /TAXON_ID=0 /ORGANISM="Stygamoeba regulata, Strain BSH-02190019" /LENGTH=169 /DNA_ID=CAMNT_0019155483 /DNA_START=87 /DNA_END=596 /DNA_ORIENTATION=+